VDVQHHLALQLDHAIDPPSATDNAIESARELNPAVRPAFPRGDTADDTLFAHGVTLRQPGERECRGSYGPRRRRRSAPWRATAPLVWDDVGARVTSALKGRKCKVEANLSSAVLRTPSSNSANGWRRGAPSAVANSLVDGKPGKHAGAKIIRMRQPATPNALALQSPFSGRHAMFQLGG
jgi:hypothetical protein